MGLFLGTQFEIICVWAPAPHIDFRWSAEYSATFKNQTLTTISSLTFRN